jgi:hypothetical protein
MAHDPLISQAEDAEIDAHKARRAANLFDLRRMIGGLFVVYGVILVILGLGASDQELEKAAGWNLNLSVGISMLVVGALFLLWAFARPLGEELEEDDKDEDGERFVRPEGDRTVVGAHAPTGPDAAALAGSKTTRRQPRRDRSRSGRR